MGAFENKTLKTEEIILAPDEVMAPLEEKARITVNVFYGSEPDKAELWRRMLAI